METSEERIQREYYRRTAAQYDRVHTASEDGEHYAALEFIDLMCERLRLQTVLDVGAGTGRAARFLRERGREVRGVEPVAPLIEEAEKQGLPKGLIVEGSGYALPFEDRSFDAALECGVLHHVARPEDVVREMTRVARKAVFLSDSNRFGQGRPVARFLKLALYKAGLWKAARFVQTRGKMYTISEGDGLAYSYSVFDSYGQLADWADSMWAIPTKSADRRLNKSWFHPLVTAPHVLLCALRTR